MGITRASRYKRRLTGGKRKVHQKKRKFELGRPAAHTKLGHKRIHEVRARGGLVKHRAMRLEVGNFAWPSEATAGKARIMSVKYNATDNELVRTKTLVKGCIVQVDATPFRQWYEKHYGVVLGKKKEGEPDWTVKNSDAAKKRVAERQAGRSIDPKLAEQFISGRLYAAISSRPGQCGRADGYILEGPELEFYERKLQKKKKSAKTA